jgi:hypothetical protein
VDWDLDGGSSARGCGDEQHDDVGKRSPRFQAAIVVEPFRSRPVIVQLAMNKR